MTMFYLVCTPIAIVALAVAAAIGLFVYGKRIPVGHVIAVEVALKKSPQEVYALIADVPGHARWAPRVRSVTAADPHEGKPTFRMRVDRHEFVIAVTAAEPPRAFALTILGDTMFSGVWRWDITPTPTGCTVRLTERGEIYAALARAMVRVTGMEAKFLLRNLSGLAKHLGEAATPRRVA